MGELICFVAGCFAGWFANNYKAKLQRIKDTVAKEFKDV